MRIVLSHSKEVAPAALCCMHSWLRHGTCSRSSENLGRDESKLCENETEDSRPAEPLRGMRRCLEKAALVAMWAMTGPLFHYSDTWQLIINTSTTIVTFLMVFLIQNTQNRDSEAIQLKLDKVIRAVEGAHNGLLDIEELTEEDLNRLRARYGKLARTAREELRRGAQDTGTPQV